MTQGATTRPRDLPVAGRPVRLRWRRRRWYCPTTLRRHRGHLNSA
ncbi:transposase family protein [Micromonospora sp. NPDC023888]